MQLCFANPIAALAAPAITALVLLACEPSSTVDPQAAPPSPTVASYEQTHLTEAELRAELGPQTTDLKKVSAERRQQVALATLRRRVLAAEARARGLDQLPEVRRRIEQVLVRTLLAQLEEEAEAAAAPGAGAIRKRYETDRKRYTEPGLVSATCVLAGSADGAEALMPKIEQELARGGLRASHRQHHYGYFSRDSTAVPKKVVQAAFSARKAPAVLGPVALEDNEHCVVVVRAIRPEKRIPLDQVRAQIRRALAQEDAARRAQQELDRLFDESRVEHLLD
jgi:pyruvate/2-oxoglutarate dehydrogenase complex dihydrolipoamide acyltransferase (E2) component